MEIQSEKQFQRKQKPSRSSLDLWPFVPRSPGQKFLLTLKKLMLGTTEKGCCWDVFGCCFEGS